MLSHWLCDFWTIISVILETMPQDKMQSFTFWQVLYQLLSSDLGVKVSDNQHSLLISQSKWLLLSESILINGNCRVKGLWPVVQWEKCGTLCWHFGSFQAESQWCTPCLYWSHSCWWARSQNCAQVVLNAPECGGESSLPVRPKALQATASGRFQVLSFAGKILLQCARGVVDCPRLQWALEVLAWRGAQVRIGQQELE